VKTQASSAKTPPAPAQKTAPVGPALRAWVDGGARGNPGPAGYGAHIEDESGKLVRDVNGFLGIATNNVAEYQGLLAALRTARELGAHSLTVLADAQLIVRQMKGEYRVKDAKLRPLFLQAQALAAGIPHFQIQHVPREENAEADRLANEAMDRGR
jgi:ribonuclease HI